MNFLNKEVYNFRRAISKNVELKTYKVGAKKNTASKEVEDAKVGISKGKC